MTKTIGQAIIDALEFIRESNGHTGGDTYQDLAVAFGKLSEATRDGKMGRHDLNTVLLDSDYERFIDAA